MTDKFSYYQQELDSLQDSDNQRYLRNLKIDGKYLIYKGDRYLNLSSNDYLGISSDIERQKAFLDSLSDFSLGSVSSRSLTGNHEGYEKLENSIRSAYGLEACLIFNSGYHANTGILPSLCSKNDLILADKLIHASLIDGIRLSRAKCIKYRHLEYNQLESLLKKYRPQFENVFIVTESVFSMDGDIADLQRLIAIKKKYKAFLYVDEAHAVGAIGKNGLGCAEDQNCINEIDFILGTFGKAIASHGAYIVCDKVIRDFLVNKARTLIYTTALPKVNIDWTYHVFTKLPELKNLRSDLKLMAENIRKHIVKNNWLTAGSSHIVPLIIGDNLKSIKASEYFMSKGLFALPIRPPTVPESSARLRFSLNVSFTEIEITKIIDAIAGLKNIQIS